jgi:putative endonuclease
MKGHNYFVYIITNTSKKVLYIAMTNDLQRRLVEHEMDSKSQKKTFAGKYNCFYLLFWERYQYVYHAIEREKEIKGWSRKKKEELISGFNPDWEFLNDEIQE